MTPEPVGPVHPVIPMMAKAIDMGIEALHQTARNFITTAEDAHSLRSQVEGVIERLEVVSALLLDRERELNGSGA